MVEDKAQRQPLQVGLRASIVLAVVVGLTIPALISSFLTLGYREQALTERLASEQLRLVDILALGMQEPLWNFNVVSGRPLFDSLLGDERIVAIEVLDDGGQDFLVKEFPERRKGAQLKVQRAVVYNDKTIGKVQLEIDSALLDHEIAIGRRSLAATVLAQLLLSLVLIVALLQRRLLQPIRRLTQESERLAQRDLSTPFIWHRRDELGTLGGSLEQTRQALQTLFNQIETKNLELQADILRRTHTERELQLHRDHLEELVKERTAELLAAKERADVANQAKSTFLASMTHELRTPLNAVLGYAQILKRDKGLSERQALGLNTIQQSGEHLLMLISDLLDLAKIESGKFELSPEAVNLAAFLTGIGNIIRVKAEQKHLRFSLQLADMLPRTVLLDEKRVRQILLNILGNAVKFTDQGQISLSVTLTEATPPRLRFEVQDSGVGMTGEQLEKIFQPFEQVGEAHRKFGGTGLGLSISRQLVRLMDSDIEVHSQHSVGSLFCFELWAPAVDGDIAAHDEQAIVVGYLGPRRSILVVDDVPANREMLKDLLEDLGFEVRLASDGLEGLTLAQRQPPDMVLMDIVMPIMDGLEATRRIRATPGLQSVPIIAISASVAREDQHQSLLAGADDFMLKPVDQNLLLQKIGVLLALQLRYEAPAEVATVASGAVTAPPLAQMRDLYELALVGNMHDIRRRADEIEALDSHYQAFAERLRQLAKDYQSKAILEWVRQHMDLGERP
ncbi:MAG: response regulator [Pseudomonas sp.]|uniref:response regulator n=1 Tax=Pseudomonas sp. TaxID=306 RepID=UPI003394C56D